MTSHSSKNSVRRLAERIVGMVIDGVNEATQKREGISIVPEIELLLHELRATAFREAEEATLTWCECLDKDCPDYKAMMGIVDKLRRKASEYSQ